MTQDDTPEHVTVNVWSGGRIEEYDDLLETEPEEYDLEIIGDDTYYVPHEDHIVLADQVEHHGKYAFDVVADVPVELHVETSDNYHDTIEGFEQGTSVERGLLFKPGMTDQAPFQTELWGCIRMRVEQYD